MPASCGLEARTGWLNVVSALGPLVIASAVAYMIWQQYKVSRDQLRLALFEKRYKVYEGMMGLIWAAVRNAAVDIQDIQKVDLTTHDTVFLYEADIKEYLKQVRKKAIELHTIPPQIAAAAQDGNERSRLEERRQKLAVWFTEQLEVAQQKFHKYLHFKTHL